MRAMYGGFLILIAGIACSNREEKSLVSVYKEEKGLKKGTQPKWKQYRNNGLFLKNVVDERFFIDSEHKTEDLGSGGKKLDNTGPTRWKVVTAVLNVRNGPGINYSIVRQLKFGDLVDITKISGIWGMINRGEHVSVKYMKKAEGNR